LFSAADFWKPFPKMSLANSGPDNGGRGGVDTAGLLAGGVPHPPGSKNLANWQTQFFSCLVQSSANDLLYYFNSTDAVSDVKGWWQVPDIEC
jgi:hypothetical protein